ncbi:MAG: heavy metal-binding domain-containing protein [Paludibacter sp.]
MKKLMILSTLSFFLFLGVSCGNKTTKTETLQAGDYYTCTMHPEIHEEKPGDCPKCGMTLVLKSSIQNNGTEQMEMSNDSSSIR